MQSIPSKVTRPNWQRRRGERDECEGRRRPHGTARIVAEVSQPDKAAGAFGPYSQQTFAWGSICARRKFRLDKLIDTGMLRGALCVPCKTGSPSWVTTPWVFGSTETGYALHDTRSEEHTS